MFEKKKSFKKAFNVKDDYRTPTCLVRLVLPLITAWTAKHGKKPVIWCPFDREDSNFVTILMNAGYDVVYSHIKDGGDFFTYSPDVWDIAVSNPPFSLKLDIFKRLVSFGKPWAMIMNAMAENYQNVGEFFYQTGDDIQFLKVDKKVSFDGNTSSFMSEYVCYKMLDKTRYVHLENNNSKGWYKP